MHQGRRRRWLAGRWLHRSHFFWGEFLFDDPSQAHGQLGIALNVRRPFGLVSIQHGVRQTSLHDRQQFPAKIEGVPDARLHTGPRPGRHQVRGVAHQKDSAGAPVFGVAHMVIVKSVLVDGHVVPGHAHGPKQAPKLVVGGKVGFGLVGLQRQFPAVVAQTQSDIHHRPFLV